MGEFMSLGLVVLFLLVMAVYAFKQLSVLARSDRVVLVTSKTNYITQPFTEVVKKYIAKTEEMNFVELGSGYAKITKMAAQNYTWKSITAIEMDFFAVLIARLKNRVHKLPIRFVKSDIFKYDIPKKSVIYCYMSVPVLKRLLKTGAFEDSLVFSLTFAIEGATPIAEYKIKGFQKRLYVYDFRSA